MTAATGPRLRRRRLVLLLAIATVLIVAISVVAVSCGSGTTTTGPTVRVDRGPVTLAVSATGNITPAGQQGLGFADGGTVTQVLVKVGDRVTPGQVLARIDDTVAKQTLAQRQATLDQQLATLGKLQGSNTVQAAQASLDQARDAEAATRKQVDATNTANRSATDRARTQLAVDERALTRAQQQLDADRSSCRSSPRSTTGSQSTSSGTGTGGGTVTPTTTSTPGGGLGTATGLPTKTGLPTATTRPTTTTTRPTTTTSRPTTTAPTVTARVALRADSSPLNDPNADLNLVNTRSGAACSRLVGDRSSVQSGQSSVVSSRSNVDAAQQREDTDGAAGQVSITNAQGNVTSAQNQLTSASNDRPGDIGAQAAQVRDAQAGIVIAQQDVDQTVITAPVAGTITAINGQVGEVVGAPTAVTPQSPGGTAPLPLAQSNTSSSGGSSATPPPGEGAFVTLDTADPFQLVVPFEEADAARVAAGQQVDVAVDALPDDPLHGTVTSVAPAGQNLSGIISYYTTVVVQGGADRLRDGQTAEANVRVESVDNVLRVPASAVRRDNGRPTVTVAGPDGKPVATPFLAGLVGDDYVEVRSGLSESQQVVLPQATVTAAPRGGGPPRGN